MLIPQSRSDQLALARNMMKKAALCQPGPVSRFAGGELLRVLVPHYDPQQDKVRMFDVIGQTWIKDELRSCQALRELETQQPTQDIMPIDRTQPTRFWLDTLIWLYQTRRSIVLAANELVEQVELLVADLTCPLEKSQVFEWFVLGQEQSDDSNDAHSPKARYAMRG
ncbi:hypothetical protein [Pusillimonas sp. T2]|uniref:hypothetical protein n=1 Tax=Pusillimonas sp. T2 TaxID=1548123 RepID=UPI00117A9558|nr:hypothetical protein [Pusillimonas sp. T2]